MNGIGISWESGLLVEHKPGIVYFFEGQRGAFCVVRGKGKFGNFVRIFEGEQVGFPIRGMVHIAPEQKESDKGNGGNGHGFQIFFRHRYIRVKGCC